MKKNRKVGNATSANFFTSQFRLKPSEPSRQQRHRKMNTTLNSFKHQLFQQETKRNRQGSKDSKPIIEQLRFLNHREDDFKLPQSQTKRSQSKSKEQSRLKIEMKNNQMYNEIYQEITVNKPEDEKKKQIYHLVEAKRSKPIHFQQILKEKLEKTALQKFHEAISKENEENQNVVSEKTAESLYLLLKTARMKQLQHKNFKFKSMPSENEEENIEMEKNDHRKEVKDSANKAKPLNNFVENIKPEINTNINLFNNVAKSKQTMFKTFEQPEKQIRSSINKNPDNSKQTPQPNDLSNLKTQTQGQKAKANVILFKKVVCDNSQRQKFTSSEMQQEYESDSDSFDLKQQSSIAPKKNSEVSPHTPLTANTMHSKKDPQIVEEQPKIMKKTSEAKPNEKVQKTKKHEQIPPAITKKPSIEDKTQIKPDVKQKRYEESDLDGIPSAEAVVKDAGGRAQNKLQRKDTSSRSNEFLDVNNNKIEKVLTDKYFEKEKQQTINKIPSAKMNPPPKLSIGLKGNTPKVAYKPAAQDDDEVEEINFGGNKNKVTQPQPQQQPLPKATAKPEAPPEPPKKAEQQRSDKPKPVNNLKEQPQVRQQPDSEQQSEVPSLNNELAYFIQRIQDIGQYRIKSKDVYTDKSIDEQLLKIHKICAYYMAHQFLFLAQRTCSHFKNEPYQKDFFDLTCEDLKQLKQEGALDDEIANLQQNIDESKKLLKKCYDECKRFLKTEQQILIMDGKQSYHIKCCAFLIKEFKKVYELLQKNKKNTIIVQRCVYLIEIYCALKLLNGEQLKQYEQFEDIQNALGHIQAYKKLLITQ